MGWTAGGGFEYALTNNWSLKGEYAFAHFGEEDFLFPSARAGVRSPGSSQITNGRQALNELALQTMKMGLNYRF